MSTKNVIVDEVPNMQKRTPLSKPYTERSLHDSGFISPPTQVKFEPDTPCHYFLRGGNFRWSSTPLPVAECFNTPFSRSNSSPSVLAASTPQSIDVLDFQTRLKNIGEGESPFEDTVTSASDSGWILLVFKFKLIIIL